MISVTSNLNKFLDKLGKEEIELDLGDYTEVSIRPLAWLMQEFNFSLGSSYKEFCKQQDVMQEAIEEIYGSVEIGTPGNCVFNLFYDFIDEIVLEKDQYGVITNKKVSKNQWSKLWKANITKILKAKTMRLYKKDPNEVI
tara:strand:- start:1448 stop:1867 length:420 start_codon:yes stop_codon:yes gene_type:complete